MKGVRIDDVTEGPGRFAKVFRSVLEAFAPHYWYIDGYGPFTITDKPNFRELDAELDRYSVYVEGLEDGPPGLWRPGFLAWAAPLLVVDEGTTLVGILGDEISAVGIAGELNRAIQISRKILELIADKKVDIALLYIDGWWEVYAGNAELMKRVARIDNARETDSENLLRLLYPHRPAGG